LNRGELINENGGKEKKKPRAARKGGALFLSYGVALQKEKMTSPYAL